MSASDFWKVDPINKTNNFIMEPIVSPNSGLNTNSNEISKSNKKSDDILSLVLKANPIDILTGKKESQIFLFNSSFVEHEFKVSSDVILQFIKSDLKKYFSRFSTEISFICVYFLWKVRIFYKFDHKRFYLSKLIFHTCTRFESEVYECKRLTYEIF